MAMAMQFDSLPLDILPPILAQLTDRRDWYACARVNWVFNRAATPLLYRTLDSRISKGCLSHPSATLLRKPELALYVRHVTETGTVHSVLRPGCPTITSNALAALSLCKNLSSMTWIDDNSTPPSTLLSFLDVLRYLPLRSITIRTHRDMGEEIWMCLTQITGLRKISLWCMAGPPRVLQGWSEPLGSTLTHLELGVSLFSPPCLDLLSQLPRLRELRLKGAPSAAIPTILQYLPNLVTLDTEYLGQGNYRQPDKVLPRLRNLTVRTSSMDALGPQKLWAWIMQILPQSSLECFILNAFSTQGHTSIPRMFLLDLAKIHGGTLQQFLIGTTQLTLKDIECLCCKFPYLEELTCSVASPDSESITQAIANARHLTTLKLQVQWIPSERQFSGQTIPPKCNTPPFTIDHATELMSRDGHSQLRVIGIGPVVYIGRWIYWRDTNQAKFEVIKTVDQDKWYS